MRKSLNNQMHKFSVAPMMEWTDRHDRSFLRIISAHALLYTEMVTSAALVRGGRLDLLEFNAAEHPIALQLGGSDPEELAQACRIAQDYGYDEVNLNVGCPSDRVQSGSFGACLMKEPDLVARCIEAMQAAISMPVTVKCRIGVDDQREQEALPTLITQVREAGCTSFTVHARKAWLKGLSPKENRTVPPLNYPIVYEMKKQFSDLEIIINGGITTLEETEEHLTHVDGVMMGRAAYVTPYILAQVDQRLFGSTAPVLTRHEIIERFLPYIEEHLSQGVPLHAMTRHILGLFHGEKGARSWRRHLSTYAVKKDAGLHTVREALAMMEHVATPEASATPQHVKV